MTTIAQIHSADEYWSLDDHAGEIMLHYMTEHGCTTIPLPPLVLAEMAARLHDRTPIRDRAQCIIPFRRRVA
jgi:hypothetical protein